MRAKLGHLVVMMCLLGLSSVVCSTRGSTMEDLIDIRDILQCRQGDPSCGPIALNCSVEGTTRVQTVLTDLAVGNMTRYTGPWSASSLPQSDIYAVAAQINPPGLQSSCLSRSPGVPSSCTQGCVDTQEIFSKTWDVSGNVICSGTYPDGPTLKSVTDRGTVGITILNECRSVQYGPPWMATVRDEWGYWWALQSAATPMGDYEAWLRNLKSVYWPRGWIYEEIIPKMNETKAPYLVRDDCIVVQLTDSNGNTWQMYDYPAAGAKSVLSDLSCYKTHSMIDTDTRETSGGRSLSIQQLLVFLFSFSTVFFV